MSRWVQSPDLCFVKKIKEADTKPNAIVRSNEGNPVLLFFSFGAPVKSQKKFL